MRLQSFPGGWQLSLAVFVAACCLGPRSGAQNFPGLEETRVIIIGVVHKEGHLIRADSLLPIIRAISPDLLLVESDSISGYFTKDLRLKKIPWYHGVAKALRIWPDISPEMKATYQYHREKPEIPIKPFDQTIPGRRKYLRNWQQQERAFLESVSQASEKGLLGDPFIAGIQQHQRQWTFFDSVMTRGYFALNQRAITDSARRMMQEERILYQTMLDSIGLLQNHRDNMMHWINEWDQRNRIMADKMLEYVAQYPGKTILVHTGALHKYYLLDLLTPLQARQRFRLFEYYEYLAAVNTVRYP